MRASALVLAVLLAGCMLPDVIIAPQEDVLVVELVLRAGQSRQVALLHGTTRQTVEGAVVALGSPMPFVNELRLVVTTAFSDRAPGDGIPTLRKPINIEHLSQVIDELLIDT
jgi:hypothetical protein